MAYKFSIVPFEIQQIGGLQSFADAINVGALRFFCFGRCRIKSVGCHLCKKERCALLSGVDAFERVIAFVIVCDESRLLASDTKIKIGTNLRKKKTRSQRNVEHTRRRANKMKKNLGCLSR